MLADTAATRGRRWPRGLPQSGGIEPVIEIVFIACLVVAPDSCEERALTDYDSMSELQCMMNAHAIIANWTRSNPHLKVEQWRCQIAREDERDA
jgi:hypothetical protein